MSPSVFCCLLIVPSNHKQAAAIVPGFAITQEPCARIDDLDTVGILKRSIPVPFQKHINWLSAFGSKFVFGNPMQLARLTSRV